MKYQIQKYETANMENRVVQADTEVNSEAEANTWYQTQVPTISVEEGFQLALVPESHAWFKLPPVPTEEPPTMPNPSTVEEATVEQPTASDEPKRPSFAEIARHELQRGQEERVKRHKAELANKK